MGVVSRRSLLVAGASSVTLSLVPRIAGATLVRSVSLPELVRGSSRIMVVTALAASSHYEELGRRRRIVTDTRVRVERTLAKRAAAESELLVRTLGGSVGRAGELVHGQAQLVVGVACVAFLLEGPDGLHYVNAMAQGHYPLDTGAGRRLLRSPDLGEIIDFEQSAVKQLSGRELLSAAQRIQALTR